MSLSRTTPGKEITILAVTLAEPEALEDVPHGASIAADGFLYDSSLAARFRAGHPVICVISRVIAWNAAEIRLVERNDCEVLRTCAQDTMDADDRPVHSRKLCGLDLSAECAEALAGVGFIGEVSRIDTNCGPSGTEQRALKRASRSFGWESLRVSELGIADLVADGLTNREIGARLFLSRHTVDSHLRHIFWKLGINSRVELTRLVVEHGVRLRSRTRLGPR